MGMLMGWNNFYANHDAAGLYEKKKKTKQQILLQLNLINKADVKRVGRLLCIPTRALETNIQGHCINIFCRMVRGGKERK